MLYISASLHARSTSFCWILAAAGLTLGFAGCSEDCPDGGDPNSFFCSSGGSNSGQSDAGFFPDGGGGGGGGGDGGDGGSCTPTATSENSLELCRNGKDDDCNGSIDGADPGCTDFAKDRDGDGWCPVGKDNNNDGDCQDPGEGGTGGGTGTGGGSDAGTGGGSDAGGGGGGPRGDCDDNDKWRNPGLPEVCDGGKDNDCDPNTLEDGRNGACSEAKNNNCYLRFRNDVNPPAAYLMCLTHVSYWRAREVCTASGMSLTRIDNNEENSFVWHTYHDIIGGESPRGYAITARAELVESMLGAVGYTGDKRWDKGSYWIGLYDSNPSAPERGWVTEKGKYLESVPATYFNWAQDEPNHRDSRCGRVVHERDETRNKRWTDRNCDDERYKFVCERF